MVHINILKVTVQREDAVVQNRKFGLQGFYLIEILCIER